MFNSSNNVSPLLYLTTPGLGENLFAMPIMSFYNKSRKTVFVCNERNYPLLKYYKWMDLICVPSLGIKSEGEKFHQLLKQLECIIESRGLNNYTSHLVKFCSEFKDLSIPSIPLNEPGGKFLNYRESCCYRHNIPEDVSNYPPIPPNIDNKKRIVLYQGSRENLRRIPSTQLAALANACVSKFKEYEIICLVDPKQFSGIKIDGGIVADDTNLSNTIELMSKGIDVFVGPDSGMTWLATSYDLPQVFIGSRTKPENIFFANYLKDKVRVFTRPSPNCERNCLGRSATGKHNTYVQFENLQCRELQTVPCLNFTEGDIQQIVNLIESCLESKPATLY